MTRIHAAIAIVACIIGCAKKPKPESRLENAIITVDNRIPDSIVFRDIVISKPPHRVLEGVSIAFPPATFYFGVNVDSLKMGQKRVTLPRVATWLNLNPGAEILVSGYADTSGPAAYNQKLSARRAARVRGWLLQAGIDPARVTWEARGELPGPPAKCRKVTVTLK